jgi:putative membrane protein
MMWGGGWFGMIFGSLFMILGVVGAVAGVAYLARQFGAPSQGAQPPSGRAPLDILKECYARGEIDKEEYEERHRVLGE